MKSDLKGPTIMSLLFLIIPVLFHVHTYMIMDEY